MVIFVLFKGEDAGRRVVGEQHRLSPIHGSKRDAFIGSPQGKWLSAPAKAAGHPHSVKLLGLLRWSGQQGREGFVSFLGKIIVAPAQQRPQRAPQDVSQAPAGSKPQPWGHFPPTREGG